MLWSVLNRPRIRLHRLNIHLHHQCTSDTCGELAATQRRRYIPRWMTKWRCRVELPYQLPGTVCLAAVCLSRTRSLLKCGGTPPWLRTGSSGCAVGVGTAFDYINNIHILGKIECKNSNDLFLRFIISKVRTITSRVSSFFLGIFAELVYNAL